MLRLQSGGRLVRDEVRTARYGAATWLTARHRSMELGRPEPVVAFPPLDRREVEADARSRAVAESDRAEFCCVRIDPRRLAPKHPGDLGDVEQSACSGPGPA